MIRDAQMLVTILYENGEYKTLDIEKVMHDARRISLF